MIDYSDWERKKLSVDALQLDKENPRLPEDMMGMSQAKILKYMLDEFDVRSIAKSIAKNGFFINELPIVAKEGNHFVVVEGNRRISALKLLRKPELAPARKSPTYRRLSEGIEIEMFSKLEVVIAPSKDAALPIILARHTAEMTKPWNSIMKARFLASSVLHGVAHEEIAERLGIPVADVKTAAITILIREMIRESEIDDEEKALYLDKKFQITTLQRYVTSTKHFSELTGLELVGAKLKFKIPENEFLAIILHLCSEIVSGDITATLHDKKQRKNYLDELFEDITEGMTGAYGFAPASKEEEREDKEPRKPKPPRRRERLIPETFTFITGNKKLDGLIEEGQNLQINIHRYCGGLLLRTILDLGVQRLYEINDCLSETIDEKREMTKSLSKRISHLCTEHKDWFPPGRMRKDLLRFAQYDNSTYIHLETLNNIAHGDHGKPSKETLGAFWGNIEPLIELVLEEG